MRQASILLNFETVSIFTLFLLKGVFHFRTILSIAHRHNCSDMLQYRKISRIAPANGQRECIDMKQLPVRILGIAPYEGMRSAMERVAEEYPDVHTDVFTGDLEEGAAIVQAHLEDNYDCIISRGGTARMIRKVTDTPVVEISLTVYDVLRTIKLAENYSDRYAIVGFSSITEPAHTLCDLLHNPIDIFTVHDTQEIRPLLTRLQQTGYRMVVGDMVTHTIAQEMGLNAFLITSGAESLHSAFRQAITLSGGFRRLRLENLFLNSIMREESENILVLDQDGDVAYAQPAEPNPELLALFREKLPEIPGHTSLKFHQNQRGRLFRIVAQQLRMGAERYYLYHYSTGQIPLRGGKNGIRSFSRSECEHLFNNSFYNLSGALGELDRNISSLAAARQPVMIIGETGTGKEQIARLLYLRSPLSSKPYVVVDCALISDKSWDYLMNHYNSPLNDNSNTIHFQNFDCISGSRAEELMALILSTDLAGRDRLLFSCTCPDGAPLPEAARKLMQIITCIPLMLPTLRSRQDEIPSLASLYLGSLNLEMGKQISGFDPQALEQLRRYSWPDNYTQFKRVLQELATLTNSYYIRSSAVSEILARERTTAAVPQAAALPDQAQTLDQIIRTAIEQALLANNGNQTAAAKQLGIGRTTMWRHLNQGGK